MATQTHIDRREVTITTGGVRLGGFLSIPEDAAAVVVFAHGSGSSRFSPRNRFVADRLNDAGLATLLFDLFTPEDEAIDEPTGRLRFDIAFLAGRLTGAVDWVDEQSQTAAMTLGLFGASTGAAAALVTAADRPDRIAAVVSRGGRPDLAADALPRVQAPTLMIVGGEDLPVIDMNREAADLMQCERRIEIVPGAHHLFEERGALAEVADLACGWFTKHLSKG
jgi:putative phosphoribosyl transferase